MQKIVDLLKTIGASDELAQELLEAIQGYASEVDVKNRAQYKALTEKAKKVCVEYVENEVLNNARKLKVFMEAKEREIEEAIQRARKLEESEAVGQLKQISSVLNGGQSDVNLDAMRELAASRKATQRLEKAYTDLKEDRNRLAAGFNRSNALAERAMVTAKRYRAVLAKNGLVETTTKPQPKGKTVKEDRRAQPRRRTIGESRRRSARPQTTRPTKAQPAGRTGNTPRTGDPVVDQVARSMESDL